MSARRLLFWPALLAATSAAAQRPEVARVQPVSAEAAIVIHDWTACAAKRYGREAHGVLRLDYRTPEYAAALGKLARKSQRCLYPGEAVRIRGSLMFAGGLAEALYEREHAAFDAATFQRSLADAQPIAARDEFELIGLCVARRAPAQVRALLATRPGSDGEDAALTPLKPVLQGCIAAGTQARMSRAALRPLFALGLYRWAAVKNVSQTSRPNLGRHA